MADSPSPAALRIAQTLGLTTLSLATGLNLAFSTILVPRLLESPAPLLLRQWKHAFEVGKASIPAVMGVGAGSFAWLAYVARKAQTRSIGGIGGSGGKWQTYTLVSALAVGIVPYTWAVMMPTNKKLLAREEDTRGLDVGDEMVEIGIAGGETAHALVDRWGVLNLGRSVLLGLAAVVGGWEVLG